MTAATELHVQPAVWTDHDERYAVLLMEGDAPDRNGDRDTALVDALRAVLLARGLHVVTDPDQLPRRPVPGWHIDISDGKVTLRWPHFTPLLSTAPLQVPDGWGDAATATGVVLLFAGHGLGLHEHANDGHAHGSARLAEVAADGGVVGGAVIVEGREASSDGLDGTLTHPRHHHIRRFRPAPAARTVVEHPCARPPSGVTWASRSPLRGVRRERPSGTGSAPAAYTSTAGCSRTRPRPSARRSDLSTREAERAVRPWPAIAPSSAPPPPTHRAAPRRGVRHAFSIGRVAILRRYVPDSMI